MIGSALVLLSGGIDSAATLALCRRRSTGVSALFVDYGQTAAACERVAAQRLAAHYGVTIEEVCCSGLGPFRGGYVRGRNALLLQTALAFAPFEHGQIMIGIHAGVAHVDCTPRFVQDMQTCFDTYCDGMIRVVAPFIDHDKRGVVAFCREEDVPVGLTYSCQRGTEPPCGCCLSCLDRKALDVG